MQQSQLSLLTKKELQDFIFDHENADESKLVLQHKVIHGVRAAIVAGQISGRRKAKIKLPTWYQTAGIVYPPSTNLERKGCDHRAFCQLYKSLFRIFHRSSPANLILLSHRRKAPLLFSPKQRSIS